MLKVLCKDRLYLQMNTENNKEFRFVFVLVLHLQLMLSHQNNHQVPVDVILQKHHSMH